MNVEDNQPDEHTFRRTRRRAYQIPEAANTEFNKSNEPLENTLLKTDIARLATANKTVNRSVWIARGVGLFPLPWVDFVALSSVQLTMLAQLSNIYAVEFSKNQGKSLILSLIGGGNPALFSGLILSKLGKFIPGIGTIASLLTLPFFAGASTYAVGKVFIKHFETGGTLLDFNPENTRDYFAEQFKQGRNKATEPVDETRRPASA